jgi:hypothetical protein
MSRTTELQARIFSLQQQARALTTNLDALVNAGATAQAERVGDQLDQVNLNIDDLQQELTRVQAVDARDTASSGQIVAEEARARAERAATSNPSNPIGTVQVFGADQANQNLEVGTDGRLRPQTQTQATPPAGDGSALPFVQTGTGLNILPEDLAALEEPYVITQAGVAANRDDNTAPNSNRTAQLINASFNKKIVPEPNVLDEYASYTYAITWYLLTPDQYNEMVRSQKKNCASWQLLMQSGGAPTQVAGATASSTATAGRNKYFDLDYYIDDLEIESLIPLGGSGAANTATDIKFKVTEPSGITLIDNLYSAVSTLYKEKNVSKTANYPMAQYCLVVRFYGYNGAGELVTTGRRGTNGTNNLTDPRAIVEKFYPFIITNIKFRIPKDRVVEYEVAGKPIPHFYNKSQDRGTIPFSFELTGETVDQILRGKPVGTVYPASPGERRDSPQPNVSAPSQPADVDGTANNDVGGGTAFPLGVGA